MVPPPLYSYTAIQRYTVYSYTALYSIQPIQHPSAQQARRRIRLAVLFDSVLSAMREEAKAARQAPTRVPARPASVQLTRAAAMGPVLSDLLLSSRGRWGMVEW